MKNSSLFLCITFLAHFLASSASAAAENESAAAESLLQKMKATYATLTSYSDTTSVRFRNPDGKEGAQAECKIAFQRPAFFRIDGESRSGAEARPKREVIWSDEKSARSWSTNEPVTSRAKVQLAGSKMFGTYAYHIPTLLEASYGGPRRLHQLATPKLAGDELSEGVECYRIQGDWQGDAYEVWLGKSDLLVRKIIANYKGYAMEEIHRSISVNANIPEELFKFAPENETGPRKK